MKSSIYIALLALVSGGNGLIAMESAVQLQSDTWKYANSTFKFKCVDSINDEDVIEVPGTLVRYIKSVSTMIDDLSGNITMTIPLFNITKAAFKRIISVLEILVNPQKTYQDLTTYFASLDQSQLLECILNINFLDIQPLLLPAAEVLQNSLMQSSSDILTWKKGLPTDVLNILKNSALSIINNPLAMCSFNTALTKPVSFSSVAVSQNGTIANGMWDNSIELVSPPNFQQINLEGHTGIINELKFSPDGQKLVSASQDDNTIRLWDIATHQEIIQFKSLQQEIHFSSDNNYFACIGSDESQEDEPDERYVLINRKTGQTHVLIGVRGTINDIEMSPDGKLVALVGEKVYLWNTQTRQLTILDIGMTPNSVAKAKFSPDSTLLVCCSEQTELGTAEIIFWNMVEMKANEPLSKIITKTAPTVITFSQDGTLVAFDDKEDVQILDVQKNEQIARISGHTEHVHSIDFTPDNKHLITTAHDNIIRIFDIQDGKEKKLTGETTQVIDNAEVIDNTTLISTPEEGSLHTWDIITGQSKKLSNLPSTTGINALSPDKTFLAIGTKDGNVNLLNLKTGEIRVFAHGSHSLIGFEFSFDGQFLLAVGSNGAVSIWDTKTGVAQKILGTKGKMITEAHCIADGTFVLAKEKTKNFITLYDIQKNTTHKLTTHDADVEKIAFLPNGKQLISNSKDGTIIVWDAQTQTIAKRLKANVDIFAVSPDGNTLVVSDEKHIYLIEIATNRKQILTTQRKMEDNWIANMIFNADGTLLATHKPGGEEAKIELWDMQTRMLKNTIQVPMSYIANYFFVPNTSLLVITGEKMVLFWDIHTNQLFFKYDIQCWPHAVTIFPGSAGIVVSGVVVSETDENETQETKVFNINQELLMAIKTLSFEQAFIIARAIHAMHTGTPLDLSNSPELLAIFNKIDPTYRDVLKQCFMIKTD